MWLAIRMMFYFVFGTLSGSGVDFNWIIFDPNANTVTFEIDSLSKVTAGALGFIATFIFSRVAKLRGGKT